MTQRTHAGIVRTRKVETCTRPSCCARIGGRGSNHLVLLLTNFFRAQVRNRQLREEQDAAYLASLEADQKREEEKEEARRLEEEESRRKQEEEERIRAEQLEEERRVQEKAKERERIRAEKAKKLTEEPDNGPGVTAIAIKMPDGSRKHRKFHGSATVEQLYDYVDSLEELHSVQYQLHSSFPRQAYGRELNDKTLEEVGLCPNAMLFLQPEDT